MTSLLEQKPYLVLAQEMGEAQRQAEDEIKELCKQLEEKQKLFKCIKSTREHYEEMAQNG